MPDVPTHEELPIHRNIAKRCVAMLEDARPAWRRTERLPGVVIAWPRSVAVAVDGTSVRGHVVFPIEPQHLHDLQGYVRAIARATDAWAVCIVREDTEGMTAELTSAVAQTLWQLPATPSVVGWALAPPQEVFTRPRPVVTAPTAVTPQA